MKYLNVFIIMFLAVAPYACNREESPEIEEKKNIISLESEGAFNILAEEHDMATADADGYTNGYITAAIGGVLDNTDPITLSLSEDPALLEAYNKSAFGAQSYQYAQIVPTDRYAFENQTITFQQGNREMQFKLRVKTVGLSPDVSYFIPLRIDKTTASEYDLKKSTILYRVYLKNNWASTQSIPQYSHSGSRVAFPIYEQSTHTSVRKEVFPISGNEVRTLVGDKTIGVDDNREKVYESWAIRLLTDADGKVTINPWSAGSLGMNLIQLDDDPDYPNVYRLIIDEQDGRKYKTFLLNYKYYDPDGKVYYWMREELKIEEQ
jgi:hypothetical protein